MKARGVAKQRVCRGLEAGCAGHLERHRSRFGKVPLDGMRVAAAASCRGMEGIVIGFARRRQSVSDQSFIDPRHKPPHVRLSHHHGGLRGLALRNSEGR